VATTLIATTIIITTSNDINNIYLSAITTRKVLTLTRASLTSCLNVIVVF